ncbi:DUF6597 domain-containing transcriptional factor [Knoellia sp. LjRoot47]|uniref:DUF6597 domain-containing transcriptional factor n=1 Tax=Knoellia sp. LjRoot47 TaxID=3342330 RepID=UPI003ECD39F7
MLDRTNPPSGATATFAGILRPEQLARFVRLRRWPASPRVSHWVENHWSLRWDLPEGRWFSSEVIPHPTCSLTVERGSHPRPEAGGEEVVVTGVVTRRFDVEVRGWGRVAGLRFRPGGLAALTGQSARAWTDGTVAARGVVPEGVVAALAALDLDGDDTAVEAGMRAVEGAFPGEPEAADPRYGRVLDVVTSMLREPELVSVADLEHRHHVSARTLQRDFLHYVGVGPKQVLGRYRMHDVVAALDDGYDGPLTALAERFGWYDQAHFTRDFTSLVGVPPSRYRSER